MPDSGEHRDERGPHVRARQTVFSERDEAIFTLALKDLFPDMTFTAHHREMFGGNRPCDSIATSDSDIVWARVDRRWSPDFYLHIRRSTWVWGDGRTDPNRFAFDPPTLDSGSIGSSYIAGDEVGRRFIQTVWRIISRISTNRVQCGYPGFAEMNGLGPQTMARVHGGMFWYGHQALAWALEGGERRMLDGSARPCDDWKIPKDRWYQDLMHRAMDTEGWNAKTLENYPRQ